MIVLQINATKLCGNRQTIYKTNGALQKQENKRNFTEDVLWTCV